MQCLTVNKGSHGHRVLFWSTSLQTKTIMKWTTEEGETSGVTPAKKSKAATSTKVKPKLDEHLPEPEDTLESESSSSSDLPAGL